MDPGRDRPKPSCPPDWKTGKDQDVTEKGHEAQMGTYLEILEQIYPGRILEGWIVLC